MIEKVPNKKNPMVSNNRAEQYWLRPLFFFIVRPVGGYGPIGPF